MIASFLAWLERSSSLFTMPLRLKSISETTVELEFVPGLMAVARERARAFTVTVHVKNPEDPEGNWDILYEHEALPEETNGRWCCKWCQDYPKPEAPPPKVYESRDALLEDHIYEPFLDWVNGSLGMADGVALCRASDGCTWAKLLYVNTGLEALDRVHWIPLR